MEIEDISEHVFFSFENNEAIVYYKYKRIQKFEGENAFNEAKALANSLSKLEGKWGIEGVY